MERADRLAGSPSSWPGLDSCRPSSPSLVTRIPRGASEPARGEVESVGARRGRGEGPPAPLLWSGFALVRVVAVALLWAGGEHD